MFLHGNVLRHTLERPGKAWDITMRDPFIGVGFESLIPDVGEPRLGEYTFSFVSHRTFEAVLGDSFCGILSSRPTLWI